MRPVEPLTSWFRAMGLAGRDAKTMKAYAYTALMLFNFLATRSRDFASASEADLLEFRLWRREQAEETVGQAAWDRDAAALGQLYDFLVQRGQVPGRPWRPTGRTASLGSGVSRDLRVRHMELEQYLFCRDVGFGGLRPDASLDGCTVTRVIKDMDPELRRITVLETGDGLDPLAVFLGQSGAMLSFSGWDRVRWRAWERMQQWSSDREAPVLPRHCWCYHDLRHTFALRLLIYLTREARDDIKARQLPMATLLDHMTGNPLLVVQRRLGHAHPSTTYRYIRYLKDPMREVDDAFRNWDAAGGASYIAIARHLLNLEEPGAPQR
ncbi:site-specific integrase [Streptomyces sp. NPDC002619]|uniref:site-specific integrase n=1 Tax=Streptomyces sp. NPDC002619 TaxID=3364655 RepID=UPI0036C27BDD